jgi:hypothetical protein
MWGYRCSPRPLVRCVLWWRGCKDPTLTAPQAQVSLLHDSNTNTCGQCHCKSCGQLVRQHDVFAGGG